MIREFRKELVMIRAFPKEYSSDMGISKILI
jgi:hypothetical protein